MTQPTSWKLYIQEVLIIILGVVLVYLGEMGTSFGDGELVGGGFTLVGAGIRGVINVTKS